VQTLLSGEGIDVNAVNRSGETAFAIAEKTNNEELVNILKEAGGVTAKEQAHPPNSAKQLKQTVSDIRHDVQSQIKQTRQTKMQVQKIKKRLEKFHIGGLNNAINSNTVVAVLIATVAFAAIFTVPGNFVEDLKGAPPGMSLGQAYVASNPAFIVFLVFDALALFISLAVVVVQTSLIVVEQKAKRRMVFVMNKLMWLACLFISVAFVALTYVVVDHNDWWLAWCTMAIGTVIMLATFGSMCYCIIAHRLEQKNTKIRKASANQSGSWSRSVGSDQDLLNSEYKKMYAL
jgi:magnesium-transporting ATPase (P-type)